MNIFQRLFSTATSLSAQNPARAWGQQCQSDFPLVSKKEAMCSEICFSTLNQLSVWRKASPRWRCSTWSTTSGARWAFGWDSPPTQSLRCCSQHLMLGVTRRWTLTIIIMIILDHDQHHETLNQHYDLLLICTMIILMMSIYLSILQPVSHAWSTGRTGCCLRNHLSLIIATLVTLGSFALAGVFICISLDA